LYSKEHKSKREKDPIGWGQYINAMKVVKGARRQWKESKGREQLERAGAQHTRAREAQRSSCCTVRNTRAKERRTQSGRGQYINPLTTILLGCYQRSLWGNVRQSQMHENWGRSWKIRDGGFIKTCFTVDGGNLYKHLPYQFSGDALIQWSIFWAVAKQVPFTKALEEPWTPLISKGQMFPTLYD
jgi:hypothetical protein